MANDGYSVGLREIFKTQTVSALGVVTEASQHGQFEQTSIKVAASDGNSYSARFLSPISASRLPGTLLTVSAADDGTCKVKIVRPARPKLVVRFQIIKKATGEVVGEFEYKDREEARKQFRLLKECAPSEYRLLRVKKNDYI